MNETNEEGGGSDYYSDSFDAGTTDAHDTGDESNIAGQSHRTSAPTALPPPVADVAGGGGPALSSAHPDEEAADSDSSSSSARCSDSSASRARGNQADPTDRMPTTNDNEEGFSEQQQLQQQPKQNVPNGASPNERVATAPLASSSSDLMNSTVKLRTSPLRHTNPVRLLHSRAQNNSPGLGRDRSGGVSGAPPLTKLQRYAVEEGIFAPLHAAIDDVKLDKLVHRLYNPEPLRHRTLLDAQSRRDHVERQAYDSLQDAHLAAYWQRKEAFRQQLQAEAMQKQHQSGSEPRLPNLNQSRASTCPPGAGGAGSSGSRQRHHGHRSGDGSPISHSDSVTPRDGSPSSPLSRSSSSSSSEASSPEWKEQRPPRRSSTSNHRRGDGMGASASGSGSSSNDDSSLSRRRQQHHASSSSSPSGRRALSDEARDSKPARSCGKSSGISAAQIVQLKRKDLCAMWMAARPPSSFQRLVSRLSYNPRQEFSLMWLVQKRDPPAGGTLLDIPSKPCATEEEDFVPQGGHTGRSPQRAQEHTLKISSPRSTYVMLRQGVTVSDLRPVSLARFYLEGSLKGVPQDVTEYHFAARERHRQRLLDEARRAYTKLCGAISQEDFVRKLRAVNPEDNREVKVSRESEAICEGSGPKNNHNPRMNSQAAADANVSADTAQDPEVDNQNATATTLRSEQLSSVQIPSAAEDDDAAEIKRRIALSMQKQQRRQDKYMQQLQRNALLMRERAQANKLREEVSNEKHDKLVQKKKQEAEARHEAQVRRKEKLERIREEARKKELERQQTLLEKIRVGEAHAQDLAKRREEIQLLRQEERKVNEEEKDDKVTRREKQHDYESLLLIDRIRRKTARVIALQERKQKAMIELKERREQNLVEMISRTAEFSDELLSFERKHLCS